MSDTFFLIVGFFLLAAGGLMLAAVLSKSRSCSQKTTAKIVSIQRDRSRYWKGTYPLFPVLTYTVGETEYTVASDSYTRSRKKYICGQEIAIRVNPHNPKEIQIGTDVSGSLVGAILVALGGILITVFFL